MTAHRRLEKTPEKNAKTTNLVCLPAPNEVSVFLYLSFAVTFSNIFLESRETSQGCSSKAEQNPILSSLS